MRNWVEPLRQAAVLIRMSEEAEREHRLADAGRLDADAETYAMLAARMYAAAFPDARMEP